MAEPASWAVVSTVDEPAPLVAAFAAHHLALGAERVFLYLDSPDPETEALLSDRPGCTLIRCDEGHWRALRGRAGRPRGIELRQTSNADHAYARCTADWLLHCDADEFLHPAPGFASRLGAVARTTGALHLRNLERVHKAPRQTPDALFTPLFRLPLPEDGDGGGDAGAVQSPYLLRGFSGHMAGKSLVRCGRPYDMGVHAPRYHASPPARGIGQDRLSADVILHFDGLTPLHWVLKMLRRAEGPPEARRPNGGYRQRQLEAVCAARGDGAALMELWRQVQGLDEAQLRHWRAGRALVRLRPGIAETARRMCPGIDLGVAGFDERLRSRMAGLIAQSGLRL